jgi:hypothetical protein
MGYRCHKNPPNRPEYDVEDGVDVSTMTAAEREKRQLGLTQEN